jgi:hypothetical protein
LTLGISGARRSVVQGFVDQVYIATYRTRKTRTGNETTAVFMMIPIKRYDLSTKLWTEVCLHFSFTFYEPPSMRKVVA